MKSVLVGIMLLCMSAYAKERIISVTGHCEVKDRFDRYRVSVMVENQNMDQLKASSLMEKRNNEIVSKIKDLKLTNVNLVTEEYGLNPVREWEKNKQVFKGYKARARLSIEFSNEKNLSKVLSTLSKLKPDEVSGPQNFFSKEKTNDLNNQCLVMALKDAKAKAKLMAKTLDASISKVHRIQESANNEAPQVPMFRAKSMAMSADLESAPQIEVGESRFVKDVYVEFELD